jgi:DNA-binding LacI/PurR family transcriptional regulator
MTTNQVTKQTATGLAPKRCRTDGAVVRQALDELHASLRPGDVIPTHKELMRRFTASERAVLAALEALQREGKIIRRSGAGTFVAEPPPRTLALGSAVNITALRQTVVVVTKPDQSFFDRATSLLFDHATAFGLKLACRFINPSEESLKPPPENEKPRGFLFFGHFMAPVAKEFQEAGCRVVLVGVPPPGITPEVPTIYGDHRHGGRIAVRHLLEMGHRHIVFCGTTKLQDTRRWLGHQYALAEAKRTDKGVQSGIQSSMLYREEIQTWQQDPNKAREYFRRHNAPTAIVEWNDHEAVTMLGILTRAGIQVPEEVSLIGYDDMPEGRNIHPALTTVDSRVDDMLYAALELLSQPPMCSNSHTIIVIPSLLHRASSAVCIKTLVSS